MNNKTSTGRGMSTWWLYLYTYLVLISSLYLWYMIVIMFEVRSEHRIAAALFWGQSKLTNQIHRQFLFIQFSTTKMMHLCLIAVHLWTQLIKSSNMKATIKHYSAPRSHTTTKTKHSQPMGGWDHGMVPKILLIFCFVHKIWAGAEIWHARIFESAESANQCWFSLILNNFVWSE